MAASTHFQFAAYCRRGHSPAMLFSRRIDAPSDGLPRSPAVSRNREPIAEVLGRHLPKRGTVLEIASGTGEHAAYFASRFDGITWQPSDFDQAALQWVEAHRVASSDGGTPRPNLLPPLRLDVTRPGWEFGVPVRFPVAIIAINLVHIAPWQATVGLVSGARDLLMPGRHLFLYGPFKRGGRHTARSNASFDATLRRQNAAWGVRDLEAVTEAAEASGFTLDEICEMPANNLTLVFTRR